VKRVRDPPQVKQCKPKRRVHKAGLHVHADHDAEPNKVDPEFCRHRGKKRNDDEGDLEEIKKKRQKENENINDDQKAELTAWQTGEDMLNPDASVDPLEDQ